jgi:hypothetical protein
MGILHEDLHGLLRTEMTGWSISGCLGYHDYPRYYGYFGYHVYIGYGGRQANP